jgi:hypothetical protein
MNSERFCPMCIVRTPNGIINIEQGILNDEVEMLPVIISKFLFPCLLFGIHLNF